MIKVADVLNGKEKLFIKTLVIGETGSGKTYFSSTFPKSYFLITEPNGEDTFLTVPALRKNVIGFDRFIPDSPDDTKRLFTDLDNAVKQAKEMAVKGEIETLVLDNITYLAESRWIYINRFEPEKSPRTGELNTQGMYGKLARWLYEFVYSKLISIPANLVITIHQMLESDEALEKKPDKANPVMPAILGGFRDTIGGMFSHILYIAKLETQGKYRYIARTNLGQGKNAKSRFPNMPAMVENISYQTFRDVVLKCMVSEENKKEV